MLVIVKKVMVIFFNCFWVIFLIGILNLEIMYKVLLINFWSCWDLFDLIKYWGILDILNY